MEWPTIITIILGSSVLGTALTSIVNWYSQSRERSRHNSFLSLTLAHAFEKYVDTCLTSVGNHDTYNDSKGNAGELIAMPPKSFALPEENFKGFDLKLLDRILEFPQKVSFATDEVSFTFEVAGEDEAHETACKNTVELANHALSIADQLRKTYTLPQRVLRFGSYDLRETLQRKIAKTKERK